MELRTSRSSYKAHNYYSGPKSSRKQIRAQIERLYCEEVPRADTGLKTQKLDLPTTSEKPPPVDTVCRVCLVKHLKLYTITNDLQNIYQTVTKEEYNKVGFPVCMCYICLAELRKCHRFVKTARDSNRVLEQWGNQQHEIKGVHHPFKTYAITQVETISYGNEDIPSDQIVKTEVEDLPPEEFINCTTDTDDKFDEIDNDDCSDNPDDKTDIDTVQDDNDRQQEAKFSLVDQGPETSGTTAFNTDTSDIFQNIRTETNTFEKYNCSTKEIENVDYSKNNFTSNTNNKNVHLMIYCSVCFKCVNENALSRHMRFHDSSRPHVCDVCQYRFDNLIQLKKHKVMHETIKKIHIGEKIYSCKKCDFKGINNRELRNHKKIHIGEKIFSCDICHYKCDRQDRLTDHIGRHNGGKPHSCSFCSFKTRLSQTLADHLKIHTGEKTFTCNICDHKVRTKSLLTIHMKKHTGIALTCDICNYKCVTKSRLKIHISRHTDDKPFLCHICSHTFTCLYSLQNHIKSKHTHEKPFSCKTCNYKTSRKDNLNTHIRTHTGEKPYSCSMCDCKYSHRVSLNQHLQTKHKIKKVATTKTGSS